MTRKNPFGAIVSNRLWRPSSPPALGGIKGGLVAISITLLLLMACGRLESSEVSTGSAASEGLSAPQLPEGKALYEVNCAECHGINGEGEDDWKTLNADGTYRAPPHDSTAHTWHHPDPLLLQIIAKGGGVPNTRMPAFEDKLTEEEIKLVLEYIKTFWEPEHRQSQADVTERMKETNQ